MIKNWAFPLILTMAFASCSRVGTISLTDHSFGRNPKKIVWFQIAGLTEEHIAILRFSQGDAYAKSAFEENTCIGKMWNYNLLDLRPTAYAGFTSEITGRKIIKNSCDDFEMVPVWKELKTYGHQTAIIEIGAKKEESLANSLSCPDNHFLDDITLFRMGKNEFPFEKGFHYQNVDERYQVGVYFDRSCQDGTCYSSVENNTKFLYERFTKNKNFSLFIVRDYTYQKALRDNKIASAREILLDLEKSYSYFLERSKDEKDLLVILTSSNVSAFEFPEEGKEWAEVDKTGNYVIYRRPSLISLALATGAAAENFCGMYDEAEIFGRVLEGPKRYSERFKIINLF